MNKMLWYVTICVYMIIIFNNINPVSVSAASYDSFDEIITESGKLLSDYTDLDYDKYYPIVSNRKFLGWNTYIVNREVKATFIEKTILEISNDKDTPVEYKCSIVTSNEARTILDASGSIGFEIKGDIKKFKNNLNGKINIAYKEEHTNITKQTEELKLVADPKTKILVTVKGNAVMTNGVAAYYLCWVLLHIGGFEYFTITNEFRSIEKIKYN